MVVRDTRKQERTSIQTRASIASDPSAGDGVLMDFSNGGLGLLLDYQKVRIGQKLFVNLETAPRPITVHGVIKWLRRLKQSSLFNYAVGLELVEIDTGGYENLLQHAQS